MKPIYVICALSLSLSACLPDSNNRTDIPLNHRFSTNVEDFSSGYRCDAQEIVYARKGEVVYELVNLVDELVADPSHCVTTDFVSRTNKRYLMHSEEKAEFTDLSQLTFYREPGEAFEFLVDWYDLSDSTDSVKSDDLFATIDPYQHDFDEWEAMLDYDGQWSKLRTYVNEDRYIWVRRTETGLKREDRVNKISTTSCSTDAVLWTDC